MVSTPDSPSDRGFFSSLGTRAAFGCTKDICKSIPGFYFSPLPLSTCPVSPALLPREARPWQRPIGGLVLSFSRLLPERQFSFSLDANAAMFFLRPSRSRLCSRTPFFRKRHPFSFLPNYLVSPPLPLNRSEKGP